MFSRISHRLLRVYAWLAAGIFLMIGAGVLLWQYLHQPSVYKIAICINSGETSKEDFEVMDYLIKQRIMLINENGGIDGRNLTVSYLDDKDNIQEFKNLISESVRDPNLIAFVGCLGIGRAKAVGPIITKAKIPYLGNYTYTQLTQDFPTMYNINIGSKEGRKMVAELIRDKASKIGYIGQEKALNSQMFNVELSSLAQKEPTLSITYRKFIPEGYRFSEPELRAMADSIKKNVDFLIFTNPPKMLYPILEAFARYQVHVPIFCGLTDIAQLDINNPAYKEAELYDINSIGIPGTYNKILQEKIAMSRHGHKSTFKQDYRVGMAGNLADIIGMIAEAAQFSELPLSVNIRNRICDGLNHYIEGHEIFQGWYTDMYFTKERSLAGNITQAWKPRNRTMPILAPEQYLVSDSAINKAEVLYTTIDMVKVEDINDDEGTFLATFYLQMQANKEVNLDLLNFSNAARNAINHKPLIETRVLRSRKDTTGFKFHHLLAKVSGKFIFNPDLRKYPLDQQSFPITLQTSNPLMPIMIQPAALASRDTVFEVKGWEYISQYVGFDQEIIRSFNAFNFQRKNSPIYKFTFVYVMKRLPIDYFLKTLVPLFTILLIAYFSVFIPPREFEAQSGIQVTSLLSAIALYFSTFKPQIQYATISDKIFIFSYIIITALIGSSILIYIYNRKKNKVKSMAKVYQRILYPMIVLAYVIFIRWH